MRLFGRTLILAGILCASLPAATSASPILAAGSTDCSSVLEADTTNCQLLSIVDPYSTGAIGGEFTFDSDVALFSFTLTGETLFSARTTSFATTGFDSTFGVFHAGGTRSLVASLDGTRDTRSEDINTDPDNPNYDDQLAPFLLEAGDYVLALVMYPNDFNDEAQFGLADSLLAGFQLDGFEPLSCGSSCGFSLEIDAQLIDGGPQPIPEPTTLALVAGGAFAAFVRRRSRTRKWRNT